MMDVPTPRIILMADDDSDDQLLAREALAEFGSSSDLRTVDNGLEVIDYLKRTGRFEDPASSPRPDLILLDLNMPCKDGREVLAHLKADPNMKSIPVVVLSTSRADTDVREIYDRGANSFITKPAAFDELVRVLQTISDYWFGVVQMPMQGADRYE